MPIVVPPFVQYQAPLFPLRGLWNVTPSEGDRFVSAEIDWGQTVPVGQAVQFQLSGNSPLAFTQIAAMQVDNTRNATDVTFLFPDSSYTLVVPAYCQGLFPVFTNALMFYVASVTAVTGDRTVFQVLNSIPPPVAVQESAQQESNSLSGILLNAAGASILIPAGINGTLEGFSVSLAGMSATGSAQLSIRDGATPQKIIWVTSVAGVTSEYITVMPIRVSFVNGLFFSVDSTTLTGGLAIANVYYGIP